MDPDQIQIQIRQKCFTLFQFQILNTPDLPAVISYHGIITQFVHEMRGLCSLVVIEPDGPLELVSSVQQQHVALGAADPLDRRGSPGHAGETLAAVDAFPGVSGGLLHPGVHVVGVEENQVPGRRGGHGGAQQEEQEEEAEPRHSAPLRAHRVHLSAVCRA